MTIQIPDDLAHDLQTIAAARNRSVEQWAIERLRASVKRSATPNTILAKLQALHRPSPSAVDDLEAAIAAGHLPVQTQGIFDR